MQENELKTSTLETNYITVMVYSLMDISEPTDLYPLTVSF